MTIGERNRLIIDLYTGKTKADAIAQRLGIEKKLVYLIVSKYKKNGDAVFRSKRLAYRDKEERNEEIKRMAADGMSFTSIAYKVGMSISAVSRIVNSDKEYAPEEKTGRQMVIVKEGDNILFVRGREQVIGKVTALNRHTVTCIVDFGRCKLTCCPQYSEVEAVV